MYGKSLVLQGWSYVVDFYTTNPTVQQVKQQVSPLNCVVMKVISFYESSVSPYRTHLSSIVLICVVMKAKEAILPMIQKVQSRVEPVLRPYIMKATAWTRYYATKGQEIVSKYAKIGRSEGTK